VSVEERLSDSGASDEDASGDSVSLRVVTSYCD